MRARSSLRLALILVPAAFAGAGGCSLINSYDDVKPQTESGTEQPVQEAGPGDTGPGQPDVQNGDSGPDVVTIPDAGPDVLPPTGVIVVSAIQNNDAGNPGRYVLAVIDPKTGKTFEAPELTPTIAALFDGEKEEWYVFTVPDASIANNGSNALFLSPDDKVVLSIRQLDTLTGKWTKQSEFKVPTPLSADVIAVLHDRLVYAGYPNDASAGETEFVIVDTTNAMLAPDAAAPILSRSHLASQPQVPTGIIGTRGTNTNPGNATVIQLDPNCPGGCQYQAQSVKVNASGPPTLNSTVSVGNNYLNSESIAWSSYLGGGPANVVAFPATDGGTPFTRQFSPTDMTLNAPPPFTFTATSTRFGAMAVSECFKTAFVGEVNLSDVLAAPLVVNGQPTTVNVGHVTSQLAYEPYNNLLLDPFAGNSGYTLTAVKVTGTPGAPTLTKLNTAQFDAPTNIRPYRVATRNRTDFTCP